MSKPSMKLALSFFAVLASGCDGRSAADTTSAQATAKPDPAAEAKSAETEVAAFIRSYNRDYEKNDMDRYFRAFDPTLTQWWPTGRLDLPTYERNWRKDVAEGGGNSRIAISDLVVQVGPTGDAAVASYIIERTPRVGGRPATAVERYQETDVVFRRPDGWKVVHLTFNPIAAAPR